MQNLSEMPKMLLIGVKQSQIKIMKHDKTEKAKKGENVFSAPHGIITVQTIIDFRLTI